MTSAIGKWLHHAKQVRLPACFVRPQRPFTLVTGNESCGISLSRIFTSLSYHCVPPLTPSPPHLSHTVEILDIIDTYPFPLTARPRQRDLRHRNSLLHIPTSIPYPNLYPPPRNPPPRPLPPSRIIAPLLRHGNFLRRHLYPRRHPHHRHLKNPSLPRRS